MLALESGRITSNNTGISIRNEFQIGNSHQILGLMKLHKLVGDEILATRAIGLEIESSLHLRSFVLLSLLAGLRLLSLISIANHLEEVVTLTHHLTINDHPRDPFVISRGLISSNQMKSRSLSTLSTRKDHLSIHSSSSSTLLNTLVREINRSLLAENERPPLLRIVLLRAKLNVVSIALLITMLALESGRITSNNMSISIRNEFQIGNSHQILGLMKFNQAMSNEILAARAIGFEIKRGLHLISLKTENYA